MHLTLRPLLLCICLDSLIDSLELQAIVEVILHQLSLLVTYRFHSILLSLLLIWNLCDVSYFIIDWYVHI